MADGFVFPGYAAGSRVEHFAWWCEEFLEHSVDEFAGQPFLLEAWQREFMAEALAVDGELRPFWASVALVLPRKNGKTQLLAAYALYALLELGGAPEVLLAAGSDKQAGRLFDACVSFVNRNPELRERVHLREYIGEVALVEGPGKLLRMATQSNMVHGYNPSLVVCDELHGWTTPRLRSVWAALTTAGGARRRSQVFVISTAGGEHERAGGLLGRLIDGNEQRGDVETRGRALRVSRNEEGRALVFNYTAPTVDRNDVDALKQANPASWIGTDYLRRQAASPELRDHEVLQFHGNVWAARDLAWLPAGAWKACAAPKREVEAGAGVVLGFDGSYRRDTTALIGVTVEDVPHVFTVGVWERPEKAPEDWRVDRGEVEDTVEQAFRRWQVAELAADPPGWHAEIDAWAQTYGSPPVIQYDTKQTKKMVEACGRFHSAVLGRELTHDGSRVLARHIGNAVLKETGEGGYIVKDSKTSPRKIDAAVAAVVAYSRVGAARESNVSVYSTRGLIVLEA